MKLLLDENLSRRLVPFLQTEFPGTSQVSLVGLQHASDREIWDYARTNGFVIVTKDADFEEMAALLGAPPQVIWLRAANLPKSKVLSLLLDNRTAIEVALRESGAACIELMLAPSDTSASVPPAPRVPERGFTLTELAVVLVIVALLIGGMMLPLAAQQDIRARNETEKVLGDIREALIGYAAANGRLPRPASSATNGTERTAPCSTTPPDDCIGFVPWATLGTAKLDGWNKLIRYSVTPEYANGPITLSTVANRTVQTRDASGTASYLAGQLNCTTVSQCVPAVVYSHGKHRHGTTDTGTAVADGSATNTDEDANNTGPTVFFSRIPTDSTAFPNGGEFDDIVVWVPTNTLVNRMIAAGRLP